MEYLAANALKIAGVMTLLLINAFFVAAEFSFVKLRETQLDPLIARNHKRARLARHILRNITSYLSATQLGITICSLGLGWFGEPVFTALLQPVLAWLSVRSEQVQRSVSFAIGFAVITFLQIVLAELGPKWVAIQKALPTTLLVARPLHWFYMVSYPFNWILNRSASWLLRRFGIEPAGEASGGQSEDELRLMLGQGQGGASRLSRDIALNALDLRHRTVREVMRPRNAITGLNTEDPVARCLEIAEKTRYSRFPLCVGGDLDQTLGAVHVKDLYLLRRTVHTGADLEASARKLIYVPATARLERMLRFFLDRRLHMAIVVDEYGGTIGLVTLENILEELVGQIQDEFDQEQPLFTQQDAGTWILEGALPLHALADLAGQPIAGEGIATASGWVTRELGGFPKTGDTIALDDCLLRVEAMDGPLVLRLKLSKKSGPPAEGSSQ